MIMISTYLCNIKIIFFLGIILLILLAVRIILLKKINKKYIDYASGATIGNEEIQEDYTAVISKEYGTLAVLADGLGKNECGRIASIIAVKTISDLFEKEGTGERISYFLRRAFNEGNKEILKRVERESGGASVLAGVICDDLLYYALVGEAMLCIFRNNELVRVTEGHTMGEVAKKQYGAGKIERDKALYALKEKKILYYMGQESFKNIEMSDPPVHLEKNDIVVLMSRGVFENIRWIELEEILSQKRLKSYELCDEIIDTLEYSSGHNNGSIVLMKYLGKK